MVVPTLSTLLSNPTRQALSDLRPLPSSILGNHVLKSVVLLLCPRSFRQSRVKNFLPSVQTLDICSTFKFICYDLPLFSSKSVDQLPKFRILYCQSVSLLHPQSSIASKRTRRGQISTACTSIGSMRSQEPVWILTSQCHIEQEFGFNVAPL